MVEIVKEGYPDFTAWDPEDHHYDPKSTKENPRWFMVDVKFKEKFKTLLPLELLKTIPALRNMPLVRKGNRLSVMPVSEDEWFIIVNLKPV